MDKVDLILEKYTPKELRKLMDECCFDGAYEKWKSMRRFIAKAINKPGSFLDIGCANGFFLECLQAWQPHELDVYGIDMREKAILAARELHSSIPDHFQVISGNELFRLIEPVYEEEIPAQYDYVYRNYWRGNLLFDVEGERKLIEELMKLVKPGGRLILGIYAGLKQIQEHPNMQLWINNMKEAAGRVDGEAISEIGTCQWIMWIDRK